MAKKKTKNSQRIDTHSEIRIKNMCSDHTQNAKKLKSAINLSSGCVRTYRFVINSINDVNQSEHTNNLSKSSGLNTDEAAAKNESLQFN